MLYPLKFEPRYKQRVWGGDNLEQIFGRETPSEQKIGESWELSSLEGDESVVCEGRLEENELPELVEVFMGDLVGDSVYAKFGLEFPVLVKFLDVNENLSVQVHPDNALALERHGCMGKTEMWYIVEARPGAKIGLGFKAGVTFEDYKKALELGNVEDLLNEIEVFKGDCFFIPAGTVHYIGGGIVLAEVQQTSDITYRVYDWGREKGDNPREIHVDLAAEAMNFENTEARLCVTKPAMANNPVNLVNCEHFVTQLLKVEEQMLRDFFTLDSFVVYVCVEGAAMLGDTPIQAGETVLVPASVERLEIKGNATLLETFMMIDKQE